jgi:hypothetical protein
MPKSSTENDNGEFDGKKDERSLHDGLIDCLESLNII